MRGLNKKPIYRWCSDVREWILVHSNGHYGLPWHVYPYAEAAS